MFFFCVRIRPSIVSVVVIKTRPLFSLFSLSSLFFLFVSFCFGISELMRKSKMKQVFFYFCPLIQIYSNLNDCTRLWNKKCTHCSQTYVIFFPDVAITDLQFVFNNHHHLQFFSCARIFKVVRVIVLHLGFSL